MRWNPVLWRTGTTGPREIRDTGDGWIEVAICLGCGEQIARVRTDIHLEVRL